MILSKQSDEALFLLFHQEGDVKGYEEIYERYFSTLAKYASWTTGDKEKGKDFAQKVLLKLFERPELFDAKQNLKTWLFTILRNQIKNEWRNENNRQKILDQIPLTHETPTEHIDNKNRVHEVLKALESLSENHKEVFLLKYSNNLSINEISHALKVSEGTVKSRIFYAIKSIRNTIKNI